MAQNDTSGVAPEYIERDGTAVALDTADGFARALRDIGDRLLSLETAPKPEGAVDVERLADIEAVTERFFGSELSDLRAARNKVGPAS